MAPQVPEQQQQQRNESIIANAASLTNESSKPIPTEASVFVKKIESKPPQQRQKQQPSPNANGSVAGRVFRIFIDGNYDKEILILPFGKPQLDEKVLRSYEFLGFTTGEILSRGKPRKIALNGSAPSFSRTPNWSSTSFLITRSSASIIFVSAGRSLIELEPYVNQILQEYRKDGEMDRPIAIVLVNDEKDATMMEDARKKAQNVLDTDMSCEAFFFFFNNFQSNVST